MKRILLATLLAVSGSALAAGLLPVGRVIWSTISQIRIDKEGFATVFFMEQEHRKDRSPIERSGREQSGR